jgi:hypothetical protein
MYRAAIMDARGFDLRRCMRLLACALLLLTAAGAPALDAWFHALQDDRAAHVEAGRECPLCVAAAMAVGPPAADELHLQAPTHASDLVPLSAPSLVGADPWLTPPATGPPSA